MKHLREPVALQFPATRLHGAHKLQFANEAILFGFEFVLVIEVVRHDGPFWALEGAQGSPNKGGVEPRNATAVTAAGFVVLKFLHRTRAEVDRESRE
ncbi:hypothetical protein [Homoserinimonas sp. OAct 916]|uniref:hypothetical protein n=1 Tax=Homoserinimonas sp. OAct 916 TaxID=2211450 RepID=UPI0013004EDC|nr:hypothetical protein [Homoserinimonas sp. OAct 916]